MHLHPQGGEKNFSGLIYRKKMCKCTPQDTKCTPSQSKSQFLGVFAGWLRFGGIFRRRRLKKGRQLFWQKKCTPADKILATPMTKHVSQVPRSIERAAVTSGSNIRNCWTSLSSKPQEILFYPQSGNPVNCQNLNYGHSKRFKGTVER